jgi:hypothetical protein
MPTETQLANLQVEASLKHGVRAADGAYMLCDKCPLRARCEECEPGGECGIERQYVADRRAQLTALEFIDPVIDGPALSVLVWQEVRITRAARYMAASGELLPGAETGYLEAQPLDRNLSTLVNSWWRGLAALGLTPPERRRLSTTGDAGPAAQIAAAIRQIAAERKADPEPVDADFEATDEEVTP